MNINIRLERLTDRIAVDVEGRYYFLTDLVNEKGWTNIGVVSTTDTNAGVTTVKYNGTPYLLIYMMADDDEEEDVNAHEVCLWYELPEHKVRISSKGKVVSTKPGDTKPYTLTKKTGIVGILIGYIATEAEKKEINIEVVGLFTGLRDAEPAGPNDNVDIKTNNGNVTIKIEGAGGVGENGNLLEIDTAGAESTILNKEGRKIYVTNAFIKSSQKYLLDPETYIIGATVVIECTDSVEGEKIFLVDNEFGDSSALFIRALGDIRFDKIESDNGIVSLSAVGTIGLNNKDKYDRAIIRFNENDVDDNDGDLTTGPMLSLSAASIGEADSHLVVDISEDLTLRVPNAGHMYLDAVEDSFVEADDFTGKDKDGNEITGDLENKIGELTSYNCDLGLETNEDIAELLLTGEIKDQMLQEIKDRVKVEDPNNNNVPDPNAPAPVKATILFDSLIIFFNLSILFIILL